MDKRNLAIDIFRGLTMALMITVNDFWSVHDVPHWLEHFGAYEDGMGLSDIVYPMFLFAMGMSIPFAIDRRRAKGVPDIDILKHILSRAFALIVMGVFLYNSETPMMGNKGIFWLLMVLAFFLIWNVYDKDFRYRKWFKGAGVAILLVLALTYRTQDGQLFQAGWWGILGQIGWMYLFGAVAYLLSKGRQWILWALWGLMLLVNLSVTPMRDGSLLIGQHFVADLVASLNLGNGHTAIMALSGLLLVLSERNIKKARLGIALAAAAVLGVLGLACHQGWIISKELGTLPWCLYVSALSMAVYALLRVLEKHGLTGWFKPLEPCGNATLTVYMIPYFYLCFWIFLNPVVPAWLSGWVGVLKCMLFAALCIATAWGLRKLNIKLKV